MQADTTSSPFKMTLQRRATPPAHQSTGERERRAQVFQIVWGGVLCVAYKRTPGEPPHDTTPPIKLPESEKAERRYPERTATERERRAQVFPQIEPPESANAERRYRGTSLIRNSAPLAPYSKTMPRALRCFYGRGWFLMRVRPSSPASLGLADYSPVDFSFFG